MKRISLTQVNNSERFFRVPKLLFESDFYKKMSADAKLLYAILKDRFELSVKNNWIDEEGNIYFIFTVEEIGEMLGYGKDKVIKLKKELKKYDLLEEVRQGLNRPNRIYLGSLLVETSSEPLKTAEVGKNDFRNSENPTSGTLKNRIQEVGKSESNDTDISDTKFSEPNSEDDEEKDFQNSKEKNKNSLSPKIEKATKYDKDYIYELVQNRFLKTGYSRSVVDYFAMGNFDQRYQYALENMRFATNAESIANYVFNGLDSDLQLSLRKVKIFEKR